MNELDELEVYPPIVREFALYKLNIQGCSPKTVSEYLLDMRTFMRYIVTKRAKLALTEENLEAASFNGIDADYFGKIEKYEILEFLGFLTLERGNKARARARKLSAIKAIYRYLTEKMHQLENNPTVGIETPKMSKTLPKFLTVDESISLLNAIKQDTESKSRMRDYAMVTLFLNCGMRLSELCGISLGDIDGELRSLRVIGKGAKERVIYLNDASADAIRAYIPERQVVAGRAKKQDNALFLSSRGSRISNKTVQFVVGKYLKTAGLENRRLSTHKLRHTAATLMYQTGEVDIRVLKDILGHEQLNTTQIYTHVSNANMEAAMKKNPLAELEGAKAVRFEEIEKDKAEE